MTPLDLIWCVVLFGGLMFGIGLSLTAGLALRPAEKVALAPAAALIVIYLTAFAIYVLRAPATSFLLLPVAAGAGLTWRWRMLRDLLGASEARELLGAYALWTGWTLGFLALVRCYFGVGAGATGDWLEHYQRTLFFLGHWDLDYRFIWLYPLPARPPLANLATGAFLALSRETFAYFQVFSTLASTLVLLPGWLLCRRFNAGRAATGTFLLLCMLNPLLLHNATYPWTKLITAYFVLAGLHVFLVGRDRGSPALASGAFLLLAAGLLAHYSAGPYLLVLAVLHLLAWRRRWFTRAFAAGLAGVVVPSALLLAPWFGWSWRHYGLAATVASNTAVTGAEAAPAGTVIGDRLANLLTSVAPLPWRHPAADPMPPAWPRATALDQYFYQFYQLTLPFAFGVAGLVFLAWRLGRPGAPRNERRFWTAFVAGTGVIGILVNGRYDRYGLAHVCLQPLVVLGLAFLAAELPRVSSRLRRVFWSGAALDFVLGALLHFRVEHMELAMLPAGAPTTPGWTAGARMLPPLWSDGALSNLLAKFYFGLNFVGDAAPRLWLVGVALALLLLLAVAWRARADSDPRGVGPP